MLPRGRQSGQARRMADRQEKSVLRRKAEAGRTSAAATRLVTPCKALSTALVKAVDQHVGLEAAVGKCAMRTGTLAEVLETVPEGGLLVVLEGPDEAQGVMALDAALLSGVIEKLMTGALSARPSAPRRATRTDAALVADAIDGTLRQFETMLSGSGAAQWASGYGYASFLDSPRPLALMLEDTDYRLLSLEIDLEAGARTGALMLVLPAGGAVAGASASASTGAVGAAGGPTPDGGGAGDAVPWAQALEDRVMGGHVRLRAELCRVVMPIAALEALVPGQSVPVPADALDQADILGADGRRIARGRLGQSRGMRAVRLHGAPSGVAPGSGSGSGSRSETAMPPAPAVATPPRPGADATRPAGDLETGPSMSRLGGLTDAPDSDGSDPLAGLPATIGAPDSPGTADGDLPDLPPLPSLPDLA